MLVLILCVYFLLSNFLMSSIIMYLLLIVYIGAMIILIGYVCAVCPNQQLIQTSSLSLLFLTGFLFMFVPPFSPYFIGGFLVNPISFFYDVEGVLVFFTLILFLFICLLMVTSQSLSPKGPFRSVC